MDEKHVIMPSPSGGFDVVINGKVIDTLPTRHEAEALVASLDFRDTKLALGLAKLPRGWREKDD